MNYQIDPTWITPIYVGRIQFVDRFPTNIQFFLRNRTTSITIDSQTGSIVLHQQFNRQHHGRTLFFDILITDSNNLLEIDERLIIEFDASNSFFDRDIFYLKLLPSITSGTEILRFRSKTSLSYRIIDDFEQFSIDSRTGQIHFQQNHFIDFIEQRTLTVEAIENSQDYRSRSIIQLSFSSNENDIRSLFNVDCHFDRSSPLDTEICSLDRYNPSFIYELIDPTNSFELIDNRTATIINRKIFPPSIFNEKYQLELLMFYKNLSKLLLISKSTVNVHVEDNRQNQTKLVFLYYPEKNQSIYEIRTDLLNSSDLLMKLIIDNQTSTFYRLQKSTDCIDLIVLQPLTHNTDHRFLLQLSSQTKSIEIRFHISYRQTRFDSWTIQPRYIDVYINNDYSSSPTRSSTINLGQLSAISEQDHYHSNSSFIFFHLLPSSLLPFELKQVSANQTELIWRRTSLPSWKNGSFHIDLQLIVFSMEQNSIDFKNALFRFPSSLSISALPTIHLHFKLIDRSTLEHSYLIDLPKHRLFTYRQYLAEHFKVEASLLNVYAYDMELQNHITMLFFIQQHRLIEHLPRFIEFNQTIEFLNNEYIQLTTTDQKRSILLKYRITTSNRKSENVLCMNHHSATCRSKTNPYFLYFKSNVSFSR